MVDPTTFEPHWASAPAETILDCLQRDNISAPAFAERLAASQESVKRLLKGDMPIDQELAARLHRAIGGSVQFWLNREKQYRDDLRRLYVLDDTEASTAWLRELPIRDMIDFGWIRGHKQSWEVALECLRFFNVPNVSTWRENNKGLADVVAFRSSRAFESRPGAVAAWLREGESEADKIICRQWNADHLRRSLCEIRSLTRRKDPAIFMPHLQRLCSESGVAVVLVRAPTGCCASGATKFIFPQKALLLLSFRYKSDDHFWFTFFHEAGHLLLHDQSALFVEGADMLSTHEEEEANEFAANTLVPPHYEDEMMALGRNYRAVIRFAHRIGVSPGIVVGQLQHRGQIGRNQLNFLKRRFTWRDGQWRTTPETG